MTNTLLNSLGFNSYDTFGTTGSLNGVVSNPALPPANSTGVAPSTSSGSGFWGRVGSSLQGILSFGTQALPLATGINNLVNQPSGQTAANNTRSASGGTLSLAAGANPLIWIGGLFVLGLFGWLLFREK